MYNPRPNVQGDVCPNCGNRGLVLNATPPYCLNCKRPLGALKELGELKEQGAYDRPSKLGPSVPHRGFRPFQRRPKQVQALFIVVPLVVIAVAVAAAAGLFFAHRSTAGTPFVPAKAIYAGMMVTVNAPSEEDAVPTPVPGKLAQGAQGDQAAIREKPRPTPTAPPVTLHLVHVPITFENETGLPVSLKDKVRLLQSDETLINAQPGGLEEVKSGTAPTALWTFVVPRGTALANVKLALGGKDKAGNDETIEYLPLTGGSQAVQGASWSVPFSASPPSKLDEHLMASLAGLQLSIWAPGVQAEPGNMFLTVTLSATTMGDQPLKLAANQFLLKAAGQETPIGLYASLLPKDGLMLDKGQSAQLVLTFQPFMVDGAVALYFYTDGYQGDPDQQPSGMLDLGSF